jgi:hypothetical protein
MMKSWPSCLAVALLGQMLLAETPQRLQERVRRSVAGLLDNEERLRNLNYTLESIKREFDSDAKLKKQTSLKSRHERRGEFRFVRLIERDGKAVSTDEERRAEEAFRKQVHDVEAKGPAEVEAYESERRRKSRQELAWVAEMPEALDCQFSGREARGGRPTLALRCVPRVGYRPSNMRARLFEKIRARLWLDEQSSEMVEAEGEAFDTIRIGWGILGHIEKGTRFVLKRRPVDGVWVNEGQTIRFAARFLLVKAIAQELTRRWSHFTPSAAAGASGVP